ncbi:MAG: class II aldolase/adducin family protein [Gammaproteobacteria bacterium]|uniref:class II aldolase/adducin family protein n=1 Tax=Rhodoferax sp. TaxID=50421 RepID=UPI0017B9CF5A|nr:class II aldolase/adducin family protein [Rhodoferax sp.]MBU3899299.1 class II aldolase/adducin family protein [Gammaproteobacteria bacterium]MBA3058180.1 class II aldolase [Rhodoferax sp.]MBU3996899.1 class II aldolase/adducin family protein [Gammaproteobacteria bacterium]MBU4081275.1 class II aldolase/adducin family protein [Gammaproteobacteria bacterium]MBU4115286.1 class II aldolase/adducin family protein [Gammaproteobacteria bacterium]
MALVHANPKPGEPALRQAMVAAARQLSAQGLNRGATGNIGVRCGASFLITPSGVPAEELTPEAMVAMDFSGATLDPGKPSSEWRFHRDILATRPDIGAVVHTHARFATALACLQREVPAFHYMIAVAGGDTIRCTPYAIFGSQELSSLALQALEDRKACLLGNHGMIALGVDLQDALAVAVEVESLCEQYWTALQLGQPNILSASQMQEVLEKFKGYGRAQDLQSAPAALASHQG